MNPQLLLDGGHTISVHNIYSLPDRPINSNTLDASKNNWIILGYLNSHCLSWGYSDLNRNGEEVEGWKSSNRLALINRPDDPPTYLTLLLQQTV